LPELSEPRRLAQRRISVSERLSSLTERTSSGLVRLLDSLHFQPLPGAARLRLLRPFFRLASPSREREVGVSWRSYGQ